MGSPGLVPPPPASGRVGLGASSHREMVSSTRLPTWALIRGLFLPAGPWVLAPTAGHAGRGGQGAAAPRGPLPAAGPPGALRPLWQRPVPCPGRVRVARPVLGLQGALQVGEQEATAQRPLWHQGVSGVWGQACHCFPSLPFRSRNAGGSAVVGMNHSGAGTPEPAAPERLGGTCGGPLAAAALVFLD